jgi:integrase
MGVYARGKKLWIRFRDADGKWRDSSTGFDVGQEELAQIMHDETVARIAAATRTVKHAPARGLTVRAFVAEWLPKRRERGLDWKSDEGRLTRHVLPYIGDLPLAEVRARHLVDMFHRLRTDLDLNLAPRTIYNIYSIVSALFRDAKLSDLIEQSPCVLDERQLGPLVDKDPEWRNAAVFTHEEVETIISDARIPADRQMAYALELLAGVRPGEAAALRWRHYDPTVTLLGKLLVAKSYNTRRNVEKTTKTDAVKHVPVHPTLAAMLAEWKRGGWAEMMGRAPTADDLVVPLPPEAAERRRSRAGGEPYRPNDYSGTQWRYKDLPALGWRHRRHYDMRATFITLCVADDADPNVLETRVTHTRKARNAFDGYNRGLHWERTCAEISKLRIARGARSSAAEQPIVASGGPDSLPFAAVRTSARNDGGKSDYARGSAPTAPASSPRVGTTPRGSGTSDSTRGRSNSGPPPPSEVHLS